MKLLPTFQSPAKYFLPYQIRWLKDKSPLKIKEKSRQMVFRTWTIGDRSQPCNHASRRLRPFELEFAEEIRRLKENL